MTALLLALSMWTSPALASGDGPEISKARGKKGGSVVLWPRVVPETEDPAVHALAKALQERLAQVAQAQTDADRTSVRPAPERVCPLAGCRTISLGAVLGHHEGGCFAVALVGPADGGDVRLVPWGGEVLAAGKTVPFRDVPEERLAVKEFVPCAELASRLADDRVERAVRATLSASAASQEEDGG